MVKCDQGALQALMIMNALGLARRQGEPVQSTYCAGIRWWLALICTCIAVFLGGWYVYKVRHANDDPNSKSLEDCVKAQKQSADVTFPAACQRDLTLTCG